MASQQLQIPCACPDSQLRFDGFGFDGFQPHAVRFTTDKPKTLRLTLTKSVAGQW